MTEIANEIKLLALLSAIILSGCIFTQSSHFPRYKFDQPAELRNYLETRTMNYSGTYSEEVFQEYSAYKTGGWLEVVNSSVSIDVINGKVAQFDSNIAKKDDACTNFNCARTKIVDYREVEAQVKSNFDFQGKPDMDYQTKLLVRDYLNESNPAVKPVLLKEEDDTYGFCFNYVTYENKFCFDKSGLLTYARWGGTEWDNSYSIVEKTG